MRLHVGRVRLAAHPDQLGALVGVEPEQRLELASRQRQLLLEPAEHLPALGRRQEAEAKVVDPVE